MSRNLTSADPCIPPELIALTHQVFTPEQFEELCAEYTELPLELTSTGEIVIMPLTGVETGRRNANLTYQLELWSRTDSTGFCCDSNTAFVLPNNACRSPDAAWVKREKLEHLTKDERERFGRFSPDFVVELRSRSDRLTELRNKMLEWIENGVSLAWLIDPFKRKVYVYRPNEELVILDNPESVSGDPLLPGFTLDLTELWLQD
ncbi:MAG TPA: Uma2 family endonuclease [Pyrinomonadaceae bacterium]|nr:Uma2 family endonuclease [Pyrinomonadaceae bacterium]